MPILRQHSLWKAPKGIDNKNVGRFHLLFTYVLLSVKYFSKEYKIFAITFLLYIARTELCTQSHYREVPRWDIFMEQELRFGLDLGRLALLKKKTFGPIMSNF